MIKINFTKEQLQELKIFVNTMKQTDHFNMIINSNTVEFFAIVESTIFLKGSLRFNMSVLNVDRETYSTIVNRTVLSKIIAVTHEKLSFVINSDNNLITCYIDNTVINLPLEDEFVDYIDLQELVDEGIENKKLLSVPVGTAIDITSVLSIPTNSNDVIQVMNLGQYSKFGSPFQMMQYKTDIFKDHFFSVRREFLKVLSSLTSIKDIVKIDMAEIEDETGDSYLIASAGNTVYATPTSNLQIHDTEIILKSENVQSFTLYNISEAILSLQKLQIPMVGVVEPTVDITINSKANIMRFEVTSLAGIKSHDTIMIDDISNSDDTEIYTLSLPHLLNSLMKITDDKVKVEIKENAFVWSFDEDNTKIFNVRTI